MNSIFKTKKKNRVTQSDVAKAVKLNRTTVTKILNNDPTYAPNEKTRLKVIKKALQMGYKLNAHKAPEKVNLYAKPKKKIESFFTIYYANGHESVGSGEIVNITPEGAVIEKVQMSDNALPIADEARIFFNIGGTDMPTSCKMTFIEYLLDSKGLDVRVGVEFVERVKVDRSFISQIMKLPPVN